ncbi:hypothetical protein ACFQ71_28565 [Streptomyces sp. NPDC056534]|uniref:hypothetical protein n=1 Tax=Streptomyces sp. NPDC056534 TaxID=3345857 RepID=UPI0036A52760
MPPDARRVPASRAAWVAGVTVYNSPVFSSPFPGGGRALAGVRGRLATPDVGRGRVRPGRRGAREPRGVPRKGDRVYIWRKRPGS